MIFVFFQMASRLNEFFVDESGKRMELLCDRSFPSISLRLQIAQWRNYATPELLGGCIFRIAQIFNAHLLLISSRDAELLNVW